MLRDYVMEFGRLTNRTVDMTPGLLKCYFVRGLKPEIRHDVKLHKPFDVHEAIVYAQQVDAKLNELKVRNFSKPFSTSHSRPNSLLDFTTVPKKEFPKHDNFRRLTAEEIQFRRKNRLCYSCDEKYSKEHICYVLKGKSC